jgi:hypothetical protein
MQSEYEAAGGDEGLLRHETSADDVPDGLRNPQWSWHGPQR